MLLKVLHHLVPLLPLLELLLRHVFLIIVDQVLPKDLPAKLLPLFLLGQTLGCLSFLLGFLLVDFGTNQVQVLRFLN